MIKLLPYEACPFGSMCGYAIEIMVDGEIMKCNGLNPNRDTVFICELWAENYEKGALKNANND